MTRREWLSYGAALAAAPRAHTQAGTPALRGWEFRVKGGEWTQVAVPHTWQIAPGLADYMGQAEYRRSFDVPASWSGETVRIEFEAVFHSARVWVNGKLAGEHLRKGYTAFALDVTGLLRYGAANELRVEVDNSFDEAMLPRGRSSDWTHDGGICRPVSLLVTPNVYVERVDVEAGPDLAGGNGVVEITAVVRNAGARAAEGSLGVEIVDEGDGVLVHRAANAVRYRVAAGATESVRLPVQTLAKAKLWHFDHPNLYRLAVQAQPSGHRYETTFGVRSFEVREGGFYLNGERVRLMGAERMAGSNPEYGMAEPEPWIRHDHDDLKNLNCVFTRVHWQQDRRVLDYCDRHGMLIQVEVPAWGPKTFGDMRDTPSDAILQNGLDQLREMIARDRNHPSVFAWGMCNEIGGQNPPAYEFARRMYEEAKRLDPRRPRTYASHSLRTTPEKDVSGLMDFVSWNEYYGSWTPGTAADVKRNLEEIHRVFPSKPIVISEYGYCACTEKRPEGDRERLEILRAHDEVFRGAPYVGGLIFFCYNDYRTHIGDKGAGVMKQRVHGVVDVYGARKASYEELRRESSPVEAVKLEAGAGSLHVEVRTRNTVPSHRLRGYRLRAVIYGAGNIPLERVEAKLAELAPGDKAEATLRFGEKKPTRIQVDVMRPTGFSAWTEVWQG